MSLSYSMRLSPVVLAIGLLSAGVAAAQQVQPATSEGQLPPIVITGKRDAAYVVGTTVGATRTETPVEYIPQSVVSLPRALLVDQGVQNLSDALRNVSNVNAIDARDTNNAAFKIRGFNAATVVDGVTMPGYFPNQLTMSNIEQIDVLKGPAGSLFGSSQGVGSYATLGGTIAVKTSAPEQVAIRRISGVLGTQDLLGASFDVNQPLDAAWAVRLIGETAYRESETNGVFLKKDALFPSLAYQPNADTRVVLRLRYLKDVTKDYAGLPPNGTLDTSSYTLPRSLNITATGLPNTFNEAYGANVQWTQRLNAQWQFGLVAAVNDQLVDQRGVFALDGNTFAFGGAGPAYFIAGARLWDHWRTQTLSPSLTGVLSTDLGKHTVNLGVDYEKTTDDAYMAYSNGDGTLGLSFDLTSYAPPAWAEPVEPSPPNQQNRYRSTVAYLQDQWDIGALHLLGSLRHTKVSIVDVSNDPMFGQNNVTTHTRVTPRVGGVLDITPSVHAFVGYSEGFKVPTGSMFTSPPKPESSRQVEVGVKTTRLWGVDATIALFDLTRKNAAVADPVNTGKSIQTGKQRSKGLDVDVRGEITKAWSWLAAFTRQSADITEDTNASLVNKQLFNVPESSVRLATRYDARSGAWAGWGAGLGMSHSARLPGNNTNTFFTPSVTVWDAQVSYRAGNARYGLNISNLLDKQYFVPSAYFGGGQVTPAERRAFVLTGSFSF